MVVSQKLPGSWESKEKWYGTEYTYEKIPADFIAEIESAAASSTKNRIPELHLPHENQFIPKKLEVEKKDVKEPATEPRLIRNDDTARIWFKKDDTFWVPKATVFVYLRNALPGATAENYLKARLYTELVQDALEEYSYDAELAGLAYSIGSHSSGTEIAVSGYNDKLPVLLEKVLVTMRDLEVKPGRFAIIKERYARSLSNWDFQQPYNQLGDFTKWLTSEKGYINDQIRDELEHLEAIDIEQFFPQLLGQMHIETFVHGNLYKENALKLGDLIESILKPRILPRTQWPISRSLVFPSGVNYVYHKTTKDPKNINHAIEYLLLIGEKSDRPLRAKVLLLDQMTHEPAFDQLRTKEQLGYIIFSGARTSSNNIGYRFIIQSEKPAEYLEERIDSFLTTYKKTMVEMSDAEFEGHKRSLITKRLEKLKNLDQETSRLWAHIESEVYDFELSRLYHHNFVLILLTFAAYHDASSIRKLTKADMIELYDRYILPSSPSRSKLAIHLNAQTPVKAANSGSTKLAVSAIVDKGAQALGITSRFVEDLPEAVSPPARPEGNGTIPITIEDVRSFKSQMTVSQGPQPVKVISEFEELDAKL